MKKLLPLFCLLVACIAKAQTSPEKITVIAYYAGNKTSIDSYAVEKLTHIIFSFCHLKGNKLNVDNMGDTLTIRHLVELKQRNPALKIILSLGGWGGCKTCSPVFSTEEGRREFALSVKVLNEYFKTDGIDIDWEYPAIEGYPGHEYMAADKENFTALMRALRETLGEKYEVSFAAGGFENFLKESVDWKNIQPFVNKVNLMSYDLTNGNSTVTGHHTPLYSTPQQIESADHAIHFFDSVHFPLNKIVIGAAMYGRIFNVLADTDSGLYKPGSFERSISWKNFNQPKMERQGYIYYWDDVAKAPYMYNRAQKKIFTYDDERSMMLKTKYAIAKGLNGIMFWQLAEDKATNGLLDAIDKAKR